MNKLVTTSSVAACGLATSIATALLLTVIERLTGFDLFTLSVWVIVPVGAICTGIAAASGYYFGSLYFHTRPSALLLAQMVIVAGVTQFLIYYLQYTTLILDDGRRVSDYIDFSAYLNVALTSAHYRLGRAGQIDTGEVGQFGYWLAAIQFIGFLLGGLGAFMILLSQPVCKKCNKYLRVLASAHKTFSAPQAMAEYHDTLFGLPVDTTEFADLARVTCEAKTEKGASMLTMKLYGCPECKDQMIKTEVSVYNGRDWKAIDDLGRKYAVPQGVNLVSVYRKQ